jgi:hypothetical protein
MAKRKSGNYWLQQAEGEGSRKQPKVTDPISRVSLEPEEHWYVTLFDPQGAAIYGPFDTKADAEKWLKKMGGKGHVWRRRAAD